MQRACIELRSLLLNSSPFFRLGTNLWCYVLCYFNVLKIISKSCLMVATVAEYKILLSSLVNENFQAVCALFVSLLLLSSERSRYSSVSRETSTVFRLRKAECQVYHPNKASGKIYVFLNLIASQKYKLCHRTTD